MANIQDLAKSVNITLALGAVDIAGATKTCDYINMALYDNIDYIFNCGVITNATTFTFQQCTQDADGGGDAKALQTVTTQAIVGGDSGTVKITTITPDLLDISNGFKWIHCATTVDGAAALISVTAVGYRARYAEATMPSMIV